MRMVHLIEFTQFQLQTEKLRLIEQEIDNIDLNVTKLQDIREDDEIDMK
jgi:hypothetical protein